MKILFISDIHGINKNLDLIESKIVNENIDKFVVLGDLYYSGPTYNGQNEINSLAVKEFLTKNQAKLICMRGNCDSDVDIKASDFPICDNLSLLCVDDIDIYCTHGNEYNFEKSSKFNRKGILVYGHEHYPYIKKKDNMIYINTGSISLPRRDSKESFLIYQNRKFTLYDIAENIIESIEV